MSGFLPILLISYLRIRLPSLLEPAHEPSIWIAFSLERIILSQRKPNHQISEDPVRRSCLSGDALAKVVSTKYESGNLTLTETPADVRVVQATRTQYSTVSIAMSS